MAATVVLHFNDEQLRKLILRAPSAVQARIRRLIEAGAVTFQRRERQEAPVGVHGGSGLRGSIRYVLHPSRLEATVEPVISYADAVENGTRPHWVSVAPGSDLRRWAELKGINPYAVQHSIAKKVTKANRFVDRTFRAERAGVEHDIEQGLRQMIAELNDGKV